MKKYFRTFLISCSLAAVFSILPDSAHAQLGDPGGDPDAPIDGGLGVLLVAGVGYGIKRARESRKKNATLQGLDKIKIG